MRGALDRTEARGDVRSHRRAVVTWLLAALAILALAACARSTPGTTQPSPLPSTTGSAPSRAEAARALRTVVARKAPGFEVGSIGRLRVWQAQGNWHASVQFDPPPIASSDSIWLVIVRRGLAWRLTTLAYVPPGGVPALLAQPTVATP
jgi:hypothetical protein